MNRKARSGLASEGVRIGIKNRSRESPTHAPATDSQETAGVKFCFGIGVAHPRPSDAVGRRSTARGTGK